MHAKTGISQLALLSYLGISKSTWNEWQGRENAETRHNHDTPKSNGVTPNETRAVVDFCSAYGNLLRGYRYLAWLMMDMDVACVQPSTVYNILRKDGLFPKWAKTHDVKKKGFDQPLRPNEQWHTDFSYVRIHGVFYYFACILDGSSRKMLVWDLFPFMDALNIELLIMRAKELYPDAHARLIHDNGKQFYARNFLDLVSKLEQEETATSPFHPQSDGKVERGAQDFQGGRGSTQRLPGLWRCETEDGSVGSLLQLGASSLGSRVSDSGRSFCREKGGTTCRKETKIV